MGTRISPVVFISVPLKAVWNTVTHHHPCQGHGLSCSLQLPHCVDKLLLKSSGAMWPMLDTLLDSWTGCQLISHGCEARLLSVTLLAAELVTRLYCLGGWLSRGPPRGCCACEEGSFPWEELIPLWLFLSSYCKFEGFWVPAFSLMHHTLELF